MEHIVITEENFLKLLDEVQKYLTTDLQYIKTQYLTDDEILILFRLSSKKYLVQFRKRTGIVYSGNTDPTIPVILTPPGEGDFLRTKC